MSAPAPARVAVFVSGGGSNLQALLDRFNQSSEPVARVELVVASRGGIPALERAASAAVRAVVIEPKEEPPEGAAARVIDLLESERIEIVVLAGWLHLVPAAVVRRYSGRIINIHPALLPSFGGPGLYGQRVHRAVLASGVRVTGVTVHLVEEEYDSGRIIAQWPVPVCSGDSAEALAERVLAVEHRLLPEVVEALARNGAAGAAPGGGSAAPGFVLRAGTAPSRAELRAQIAWPVPAEYPRNP